MDTEVIVVGGGIAGLTLSFTLLNRKIPFILVDSGDFRSSSTAAGMCNPIVFRRMNLSWKADQYLPFAREFYANLESALGSTYLTERQILKLIQSEEEKLLWVKAMNNPETTDYLEFHLDAKDDLRCIRPALSLGVVKGGFQVDLAQLMVDYLRFLEKKNALIRDSLDHSELSFTADCVSWRGVKAKSIVFCEGFTLKKNPYFNYLPLKPVKGEALIVNIPGFTLDKVVNDKMNICPLKDGTYWFGGTYQWDYVNPLPSPDAKAELQNALKKIISCDFEIIEHLSGIRPASQDRRPLLGRHPELKNAYVMNGMGAKGTMLAPFCADQLADCIISGKEVMKGMNIERFSGLLSQ